MLSPEARPYIDASVPVLREHGLAITRTFYSNMFAEHPELTQIFNMGNQASGAQQQSLASAVFAYAANIDNPDALAPVVSRIVHKHASVGITAHHYPIVGRHLLGAIKQTLGDAATPDLLSAWGEAYESLANAFIEEERKLYQQAGIQPGQFLNMRVEAVLQQSANVRSFVLACADGSPVPEFQPGQYVTVEVRLADGLRQLRQYSLSDAPETGRLRISVKREEAGEETPAGQVSNWLHDFLLPGATLRISPPFGDFTPDVDGTGDIVLLSAGVGITPMVSALNTIAARHPQRRVIFGHAARDVRHHAHRIDVAAARNAMAQLQVVTFYETLPTDTQTLVGEVKGGFMQPTALPQWEYSVTPVYMCGPLPFMHAQWKALVGMGVPPERIHREVFGPDMLDHLI